MRALRACQWAGIGLVVISAFWPTFHFRAYPVRAAARGDTRITRPNVGLREVPARALAGAFAEALDGPPRIEPFWDVRRWYPWYLAPLWGLALALAAGADARRRRAVGTGLLLLTCGLIAFEAAYLKAEYLAFLPRWWGQLEAVGAWLLVVAILLYRRRADRHLGALEAAVGAQALLGFVHGVTLPSTLARQWLPQREPAAVAEAVLRNFPAPFWVGMAGLLLIALPVYLRRTGGRLREAAR